MGWTFTPRRSGAALAALAQPLAAAALVAWGSCCAPPAGAAPATPPETGQEQVTIDADSAELDTENKTGDFKQIVVTQGTMRIQAERAHAAGLDATGHIQDGRMTFQGNVHIFAEPRGTLQSDEAIVEVRNSTLTTATATGKPATFQQRRGTTGQLTRGHADIIVYDVTANTVRLTNNAWLDDGRNQISAPLVVYNIQQQHMVADSGGKTTKGNVHMTIIPPSHGASPGAPARPETRKPEAAPEHAPEHPPEAAPKKPPTP